MMRSDLVVPLMAGDLTWETQPLMAKPIQVVLFNLGGAPIELTGAPEMMDNARAMHAVRERHHVLLRAAHGLG